MANHKANYNFYTIYTKKTWKLIGQFRKNQYLCNVIELERHIEILLLSNDCVIVPGFGGFMAHHVDARYDGRDNLFLPPLRTIGFNQQLQMNDSLLVLSYVDAYDISYPEALRRIENEVVEIRQTLENKGKYEFRGIGTICLNEDGNYEFEPWEAGILTPELYGLGGVDILPITQISNIDEKEASNNTDSETSTVIKLANTSEQASPNSVFVGNEEEDEEEANAEFISIKKSWVRNIAAACIAIIAFFTLSTPLGNPTMQKSQIDTGMLTRIMPKEITKVPHELVLADTEMAEAKSTDKANKIAEDAEVNSLATNYYSIVLASRGTKHNAANYVELLQNKGFKDARVLITNNNVKVIYGTYPSESEAYSALNRLHSNEAFADGWITKVKE